MGTYEYWARAVLPEIVDVHVANDTDKQGNPIGGTVAVTLLTKTGGSSSEMMTLAQNTLSGEKIRPLCDTVIVCAPEVVAYELNAELVLYNTGANAIEVKTAAQTTFAQWESAKRAKLGGRHRPFGHCRLPESGRRLQRHFDHAQFNRCPTEPMGKMHRRPHSHQRKRARWLN